MRLYINPGSPQPTLQPTQRYRPPVGSLQQAQSTPAPTQTSPKAAPPYDHDRPRSTLFDEWHRQHGDTWMAADALNVTVRHSIDERERTAAIRQKLRKLVNKPSDGFTLEAKLIDPRANRANRATLYRVVPQP